MQWKNVVAFCCGIVIAASVLSACAGNTGDAKEGGAMPATQTAQAVEAAISKAEETVAAVLPEGYAYVKLDGVSIGGVERVLTEEELNAGWTAEKYVELSEEQAISAARGMLALCCEEYIAKGPERYRAEALGGDVEDPSMQQYPVWNVWFTEYDSNGIRRNMIWADIGMEGKVDYISFGIPSTVTDEELAGRTYLPEQEALDTGLASLQERLDITPDAELYDTSAELYEWKGNVSWAVVFSPKEGVEPPSGEGPEHYHEYTVTLDAETGEVQSAESCA